MKLLKSSLEKENDEHDVFGAYVAMEMRNLQSSDAQKKLRGEIRDSISRIVQQESVTTIDQKKSVPTIDHTNTSNLRFKIDENNSKREDDLFKINNSSSADIFNVDTVSQKNGNNSWELIN